MDTVISWRIKMAKGNPTGIRFHPQHLQNLRDKAKKAGVSIGVYIVMKLKLWERV
jgi:hypothetical protein